MNLYLVPHLLGEKPEELDIWHGCNMAELGYALHLPGELIALWDDRSLQWARKVSSDPGVIERVNRHIEIHRLLKEVRPGERGRQLVDEAFALAEHSFMREEE